MTPFTLQEYLLTPTQSVDERRYIKTLKRYVKTPVKMNATLRNLWITGLYDPIYNNNYPRAVMKQNDYYCPLGLLCELSGKGTWETFWTGHVLYRSPYGKKHTHTQVPFFVRKQLGIPLLLCYALAYLYDHRKVSFADIAHVLEQTSVGVSTSWRIIDPFPLKIAGQ